MVRPAGESAGPGADLEQPEVVVVGRALGLQEGGARHPHHGCGSRAPRSRRRRCARRRGRRGRHGSVVAPACLEAYGGFVESSKVVWRYDALAGRGGAADLAGIPGHVRAAVRDAGPAAATRGRDDRTATYVVLAMLSEAPDRSLRMTDLARLANSTPSRLSHAMARLEERGWVTRCRASEDGRGTVAMLTDAGWEVLVATAPGHVGRRPGRALRPAHPGADAGAGRGPHHRAGRAGPGGDAAPPGAGGRLPAGRAGRLTGRPACLPALTGRP